jgi:hypothetical protein
MKTIVYEHLETFNLEQPQRKKMLKVCQHEMSIDKIISILDNFEHTATNNKKNHNKDIPTPKKQMSVSKKYLLLVGYVGGVMVAFYFQWLRIDLMNMLLTIIIGILLGVLIYQWNPSNNESEQQALRDQKTMMLHEQQATEPYTLINLNSGEIIALNQAYNVIGRSAEATIQLNDQYIGRRHCVLINKAGALYIKDLNSKNGVVVNHETIVSDQLVQVSPEDTIKIGQTPVKISKSSN